ncbi:MAG: cache domain-containing protein [Anaerolineae bacterium]
MRNITLRLQYILLLSFLLVVIVVLGISFLITARMISEYLVRARQEDVRHNLHMARLIFYEELSEVREVAEKLSVELDKAPQLTAAFQGNSQARVALKSLITYQLLQISKERTVFVAVIDREGNLIVGNIRFPGKAVSSLPKGETRPSGEVKLPLDALEIVKKVLIFNRQIASVEVLPAEFLAPLGLAEEAQIELLDTPEAAGTPFDPREGTAALALVGVAPLSFGERSLGVVLVASILNNDVSLVDHIRYMTQADTVTIFLGDMQASTNVLTLEGKRAVGARVSKAVSEVVLSRGTGFIGSGFIVNERYISGYEPLRDHADRVIGMLHVGLLEEKSLALLHDFYKSIALIVLGGIALAMVLALPLSRFLAEPISAMLRASQKVVQGDLSVRVPERGSRELALLARSFNEMTESLSQAMEAERNRLEEVLAASEAQARLLETVHALSSPTIPLYEGIVVLPLVGHIDTARAQQIMEELLNGISYHKARVAILDITGVAVVDTKVAQHLLQAAQATRLLGCQVVLVGVRPEVAQTLVELGIDMADVVTCRNLQAGLEYALAKVNRKIVLSGQR